MNKLIALLELIMLTIAFVITIYAIASIPSEHKQKEIQCQDC